MTTEFVMFFSPPIELRTLSILDQRVWSLCLCVCLLMCPFAYLKNRTTKFSPNFPYIHVTVLLWRECNTLCTSGVVKLHGCFPVVERMGQKQRRRVCFVQFARWRHKSDVRQCCLVVLVRWLHREWSLLSPTASCLKLQSAACSLYYVRQWWANVNSKKATFIIHAGVASRRRHG